MKPLWLPSLGGWRIVNTGLPASPNAFFEYYICRTSWQEETRMNHGMYTFVFFLFVFVWWTIRSIPEKPPKYLYLYIFFSVWFKSLYGSICLPSTESLTFRLVPYCCTAIFLETINASTPLSMSLLYKKAISYSRICVKSLFVFQSLFNSFKVIKDSAKKWETSPPLDDVIRFKEEDEKH